MFYYYLRIKIITEVRKNGNLFSFSADLLTKKSRQNLVFLKIIVYNCEWLHEKIIIFNYLKKRLALKGGNELKAHEDGKINEAR